MEKRGAEVEQDHEIISVWTHRHFRGIRWSFDVKTGTNNLEHAGKELKMKNEVELFDRVSVNDMFLIKWFTFS